MTKHLILLVIATLCVIALYAGVGVRAANAAAADIHNLGTLGGTNSAGYKINDAGQVVGSAQDVVGRSRAFLWKSSQGMTDLGTANGYTEARALAINASGSVVGVEYDSASSVPAHAFAWTPSVPNGTTGTFTDLARGDYSTMAADINAAGQVVGFSISAYFVPDDSCSPDNPYSPNCGDPGGTWVTVRSAVLWENGVGADLINSSAPEAANAINNAGQVAGNTATHAFRYDGAPGNAGIMYDLGTLGGTLSVGSAINDAGQVVGSSHTTGDTGNHAFRYAGTPGSGGVMVDLGTVGGTFSHAYDINATGFVVGVADRTTGAGGGSWATLWKTDAGNTAIDLDAWLDAINPTLGAHWKLKEAHGINIDGLITGQGIYDDGPGGLSDGYRAFVLDASSLVSVLAGDFNGNGTVDTADYVVWRKTGGTPAGYNAWRTCFGQTAGSGAALPSAQPLSAAVPEPASWMLFCLGTIAVAVRRRFDPLGIASTDRSGNFS